MAKRAESAAGGVDTIANCDGRTDGRTQRPHAAPAWRRALQTRRAEKTECYAPCVSWLLTFVSLTLVTEFPCKLP